MGAHPELAREQAYVDRCYARLDALVQEAAASASDAQANTTTNQQGRRERDIFAANAAARARQLRIGDQPLCFGRIDHDDGESLVVGRVAVHDRGMEPLVVDWRAPAAEAFYRATGSDRMGVTRRRHFLNRRREVVGLDDEVLDAEGIRSSSLELVGEGALLMALDRRRTGRMADVVSTIQREQDAIVRAPLPGVLVVQGGPGTGKTAVALHRAAYLLYSHRLRLETEGLLFIGPNAGFIRYVEDVLPALGEQTATLATTGQLVDGVRASGEDTLAAATVKHDARMVEVLRRAVADRERPLREDLVIGHGSLTLRVTRATSRRIVAQVKDRAGTHNERRRRVEWLLLEALWQAAHADAERLALAHGGAARVPETDGFKRAVRRNPEVQRALERMWPRLSGRQLLRDLFGSAPLLARAGEDLLTEDERAALFRERGDSVETVAWTDADIALLDEADTLLGPTTDAARGAGNASPRTSSYDRFLIEQQLEDLGRVSPVVRAAAEARLTAYAEEEQRAQDGGDREARGASYGHVIVDEAQDLSAMQWRMLMRRCPSRSMTVVGDLAQATTPWAIHSWDELAERIGGPTVRYEELTIGYRTPAEVMELAAGVLAAVHPELTPPRPMRHSGRRPTVVQTDDVAGEVKRRTSDEDDRLTAVVAPADLAPQLGAMTVAEVKGLEFDRVIVVEPGAVAREAGLTGLYVALTRTTSELVIIHREPLPSALA
ncbi:MAG: AAA family ATPase [Actinobacteria bacterium]|nr:AAA family ATPase [Actinomycetota bacterium]